MRRRRFLGSLGCGALGAGLLPLAMASSCGQRPAGEEQRGRGSGGGSADNLSAWSWVHGGGDHTPGEWRTRFQVLADAGFDGVLVSGGDTALFSEAARGAGLEFHRWLWVLNRNGDRWAMENHPEWFTVNREGVSTLQEAPYVGYYRWVCPTRSEVRAYLNEWVDGISADDRVDGVHLDYIRYSDVILPQGLWAKYDLVQDEELPQFDYCYCEACRSAFEEQTGEDPLELDEPSADEAWVRFRWNSVTRLVTELAETVHARDKPISAAVFPGPSVARRLVRQAWDEWPVDRVFPMLYHTFYEEDLAWIARMVEEGVEALEDPGTLLVAGLYLPDLPPEQLAEAIRRVRQAGADGFSTFEMNGLSDVHLDRIRRQLRLL